MMQDEGSRHIHIGPRRIDFWPAQLGIFDAGPADDGVKIIPNPDILEIQQPLVDAILEEEARSRIEAPQVSLCEGGQKIRHLEKYDLAAFSLLDERARELFRRTTGSPTAYVDDCWANVFRNGEYALPHARQRVTAAVVFAMEPVDVTGDDCDPMNGALIFCDPCLKVCCDLAPHHVTQLFRPTGVDSGVMVIIPGFITHAVGPYYGSKPRISIAWNINPEPVPGPPPH